MRNYSRIYGTRFHYGHGVQVRVSGTTSMLILDGKEMDVSHIVPARDRVGIIHWWTAQGCDARVIKSLAGKARRFRPLTSRVREGWSTHQPDEAA